MNVSLNIEGYRYGCCEEVFIRLLGPLCLVARTFPCVRQGGSSPAFLTGEAERFVSIFQLHRFQTRWLAHPLVK